MYRITVFVLEIIKIIKLRYILQDVTNDKDITINSNYIKH